VLLLVLAFLAPRLSTKPQHGVDRALSSGGRVAAKRPVGSAGGCASRSAAQNALLTRARRWAAAAAERCRC